MRLYYGTTKKIAKKHLGKCWGLAQNILDLKVGDTIQTGGLYDTITEILPVYLCRKKHKILRQVCVFTEHGQYFSYEF